MVEAVDSTKEAEAVKGADKPKVSTQTPHVDIQDYRPTKDAYETEKTEEIPVHEIEESEDTSQKQSEELQAQEESSAEDKQPFNFRDLFEELNLPYDEEDITKEKEAAEDKEEAEESYSNKYADPSQESYEQLYDNEHEKSTEVGDDDHTNEDAKLIRITDEEFKHGDRDFFKPFLEKSREINSHEYYYNWDRKNNRKREATNRKGSKKYTSHFKDKKNKLRSYSDNLAKTKNKKEDKRI